MRSKTKDDDTQNSSQMATVYKYDLFPPTNWGPEFDYELRMQTDLWNMLVDIEAAHVAAVREVAGEEINAVNEKTQPLEERLLTAIDQRKRERKRARGNVPTPQLDEEIDKLKASIKEIRDAGKEARLAAYKDNKDALKALDTKRFAEVKTARQTATWGGEAQRDNMLRQEVLRAALKKAVNKTEKAKIEKEIDDLKDKLHALPRGVLWCNSNAIVNFYERARGKSLKIGRPLRKQFYNGEGRFTNQIQGGISGEAFMQGYCNQVELAPKPDWMRANGRKSGTSTKQGYTLRFSAFTDRNPETGKRERRFLEFPFIMYRPIPDDAVIKEIVITRRKHANKFVYAVIFTVLQPTPERAPTTGMPVAINLGWRKTNHGLRVATRVQLLTRSKLSKKPLGPPEHTLIDGDLLKDFEHYEEMASERDKARNWIAASLQQLRDHRNIIPEDLKEYFGHVLRDVERKTKIGSLFHLMINWGAKHPEFQPALLAAMKIWYYGEGRPVMTKKEWKVWVKDPANRVRMWGERAAHLEQAQRRRRIDARRLYFYRMEARRLIGDASLVVLNEHNMSDTAKKDTNTLAPPQRRQRFMAAPSILRQAILNYCRSNGIPVETRKGLGRVHWRCQQEYSSALPDELRHVCTHCHEYFDMDENYCATMLVRSIVPPQAKESVAA